MKKVILIFCWIIFYNSKAIAHKEWVHQYFTQEAYFFLEHEIGTITCLRDKVGINYDGQHNFRGKGDDDDPWITDYPIVVGAWREDEEDPVYGYMDVFTGGNASSSHFWVADDGDNHTVHLVVDFVDYYVHNSYEKARIYLFNGNQHYVVIKHRAVGPSYIGLDWIIRYNTIFDLYQGNYDLIGYFGIDQWFYFSTPQPASTYCNTSFRGLGKSFAWQILGRVSHLLQDQSVPAHTHGISHPCPLSQGDYYELMLGGTWFHSTGNLDPSECNQDPGAGTGILANNWNHTTALTQGGLINEILAMNNEDAIHYLFYTMNQITDFFPSGVNNSGAGSSSQTPFATNTVFQSGNNSLPMGSNHYIDNVYQSFGNTSPSTIDPVQIGDVTSNFAIRATASLLYWFYRGISSTCAVQSFPIPPTCTGNDIFVSSDIYPFVTNLDQAELHISNSIQTTGITVISGTKHWVAGNYINLNAAFEAPLGSEFFAEIGPCLNCGSSQRLAQQFDTSNTQSADTEQKNSPINNNHDFVIYPNPTNGSFNIYMSKDGLKSDITVYNILGEPIWKKINNSEINITLDISNYPKGIYMVHVVKDGKTSVNKIVLM